MARPSPLTYLPLWEAALEKEIGIRFEVAGVARSYFANTLYEARKLAQQPQLDQLMIFQPAAPFDNELWICKQAVELDA